MTATAIWSWPSKDVMAHKHIVKNAVLTTWVALNEHVMTSTDEQALTKLLEEELRGRRRKAFVMRIFHRINRLRMKRDTAALKLKMTKTVEKGV